MNVKGFGTVVLALGLFSPAYVRESLASENPLRDHPAMVNRQSRGERTTNLREINGFRPDVARVVDRRPNEVSIGSPLARFLQPRNERNRSQTPTELNSVELRQDTGIYREIEALSVRRIMEVERFQSL